jgi:two-component system sensor histidine kinase/response regulator
MMEISTTDFSILIVDDFPGNIQVLGTALLPLGYKLEFATQGKQALDWVKRKQFDLILLDVMMPGLSGFDVCKVIRQMPEYDDVPVIFLTAEKQNKSLIEGFDSGAQDYLTKPFETNELLARVKTQLQLRASKKLLNDINNNLEELVAERTAELTAAKKELEELDAVKNDFLRLLSHEIRTPLNGIHGSISLMKGQPLSEDMSLFLGVLDHSYKRLEKFTFKALDISEIRSKGAEVINKKLYRFEELLNDVIEKLKGEISIHKIDIQISSISPDLLVYADRKFFGKVLENVIENAISFAPRESSIQIEVYDETGRTACSISDSGPGCSENALRNMFKAFGDVKNHVDTHTGLSLYFCKLVMDAHKGEIVIGNNTPKGGKVSLFLPGAQT